MAATHALLTAVCSAGDHVIIPDDLYGGTYRLVDKVLARFGVAYDMVDQRDLDAVARRDPRPRRSSIWVETPTNPTLNVVDLLARDRRGRRTCSSRSTTRSPRRSTSGRSSCGAGAVVHSTTKYLGGHSDTVGGAVVVADPALHEQVRFLQLSIGAVPGPLDCFLVHRGLRTLHLRMAAHAENALAVSAFLREQPGVTDVRWPGFSGMVCFRHPRAVEIVAHTKLFALAESLGGVESLIEVPQAMTHQSVEGSAAAVPADLVRLSCGIEAAADLVEDLRQALAAVATARAVGT